MERLTRTQRILNHVKATLELYYSSLIEVNTFEGDGNYWSIVVLGTKRGKRYPLRYTFRTDEERQLFLNEFGNTYPDVPILENIKK